MEERVNSFSHFALFDIQKGRGRNFLGCFGNNTEEDTETGNSSESYRPWQDLPHDILLQIFKRGSLPCFIRGVPFVCRSWRCALWDALIWHKDFLDLSDILLLSEMVDCPIGYPNLKLNLMDTIKSIFEGDAAFRTPPEGWSQSLHIIALPFGFYISDRVLLYIARRTPNLNCFFLGRSDKITKKGFSKAIACWKNISFVEIGPINGNCGTSLLQHVNRSRSRRVRVWKFDSFKKLLQKKSVSGYLMELMRCLDKKINGMDLRSWIFFNGLFWVSHVVSGSNLCPICGVRGQCAVVGEQCTSG